MYLTIAHWCRSVYKYLLEVPDYYVSSVHVTYVADMIMEQNEIEVISDIWKSESYDWTDINGCYFWDITKEFNNSKGEFIHKMMDSIPPNVSNVVYTIKYYYGNKKYKYVSKSETLVWPPSRGDAMSFKMPIIEAWCLDQNGKRIRNATLKLKKAAGPKGNFHNQDVRVMDVIDYDYPKLEVSTLLETKILNEKDSVLDI